MKRTIKKLVRPFWRLSATVRRPLIRKFDHHMMQLLGSLPRPAEAPAQPPAALELALSSIVREHHHMMQLLASLPRPAEAPTQPPAAPPADLELALNSVVREMVRLQIQVEILQQQVEDLRSGDRDVAGIDGRLSVVGEIG